MCSPWILSNHLGQGIQSPAFSSLAPVMRHCWQTLQSLVVWVCSGEKKVPLATHQVCWRAQKIDMEKQWPWLLSWLFTDVGFPIPQVKLLLLHSAFHLLEWGWCHLFVTCIFFYLCGIFYSLEILSPIIFGFTWLPPHAWELPPNISHRGSEWLGEAARISVELCSTGSPEMPDPTKVYISLGHKINHCNGNWIFYLLFVFSALALGLFSSLFFPYNCQGSIWEFYETNVTH